MKKLLMFILFHINPNAIFSQAVPVENTVHPSISYAPPGYKVEMYERAKPDTLRAIILVTLSPNGIAHARMGFVVIEQGKRPVYLDCRRRALKLPQVGWGYEIVGGNNK